MDKYKATVYITDEIKLIGERYYVEATAHFVDCETGKEITITACAREEESKKGMDGSQVTGASSSYARKYALNGLFAIDDTKDSDATNTHGKEETPTKKELTPRQKLLAKLRALNIDLDTYAKEHNLTTKTTDAEFEKLLADNNLVAVVFPTYLSTPQYTGKAEDGDLLVYDQPWTVNCSVLASPLGLPEISVPIGQHSLGAGIGMEFASLKNSEQLLLNIAYSYTEKYDHRVTSELAPNLYEKSFSGDLETFLAAYREAAMEAERLKEEEKQQETRPEETRTEETTTPEETTTLEESVTPEETQPDNFEEIVGTTPVEETQPANSTEIKTKIQINWKKFIIIVAIAIAVIVVVTIIGMIIYDRYRSVHRRRYKKYRKYLGKKKTKK